MGYAICRVQTLSMGSRGKGTVGKALRHLDEHDKSADISRPELSCENRSFIDNPPTYARVKELCKKMAERHNKAVDEWNETHPDQKQRRHLRKGAAQCFEAVFSYSPEMEGRVPVREWVNATVGFIKREFVARGCKIARLELHRDETTTHIQVVGVAWNQDKQNCTAHSILGTNKDLCELQDRYADAVAQFGLERGYSRYRAFESVRKKALAAGYGDNDGNITTEQVQRYADDHKIALPKYRGHKPLGVWKAEQNELGIELEQQNETLARSVSDLRQIKAELCELVPTRYCDVVNRAESYEKLLKIGKRIRITVDGHEQSMTDYLMTLSERGRSIAKDLDRSTL